MTALSTHRRTGTLVLLGLTIFSLPVFGSLTELEKSADAFRNQTRKHISEHSGAAIGTPAEKALRMALKDLDQINLTEAPPVKRALLQRKLWELFDWSAALIPRDWDERTQVDEASHRALQIDLAKGIERLALSRKEITNLPNPYQLTLKGNETPDQCQPDEPFASYLPRQLFNPDSPWVELNRPRHLLVARFHSESSNWRSAFHVLIEVAGGRGKTLDYLKRLNAFEAQWVTKEPDATLRHRVLPNGGIHDVSAFVNPETPQFPPMTRFALVERALLIDQKGQLVSSPLILNVQLRTYLQVDPAKPSHAVAEWVLSGDQTKLRPLTMDDLTESHGHQHPRLRTCFTCHSGWGIHSVNTRSQLFEPRTVMVPKLEACRDDEEVPNASIQAKRRAYSWGLLQGLWRSNHR
ncbi:MAG: hypothetical protein AAF514_01245 [Verrucomicrobiota bacterium]